MAFTLNPLRYNGSQPALAETLSVKLEKGDFSPLHLPFPTRNAAISYKQTFWAYLRALEHVRNPLNAKALGISPEQVADFSALATAARKFELKLVQTEAGAELVLLPYTMNETHASVMDAITAHLLGE